MDLSRRRTARSINPTLQNPRVTDEVVYMTADEEDNYHVAQANEPLDEEGHFVRKNVSGRYREETQEYEAIHVRFHGRVSEDGVLCGDGI